MRPKTYKPKALRTDHRHLKRGDVYWAHVDELLETGKRTPRPVLIIRCDADSPDSYRVLVAGTTHDLSMAALPGNVRVELRDGSHIAQGVARLRDLISIRRRRLLEYICTLPPDKMAEVDAALAASTGIQRKEVDMNQLQIFSKEVIPVYISSTGEKVVLGRELHERLNISEKYADWLPRMCDYGFSENVDYFSFSEKSEKPSGGRPSTNHILKLDMAKHIAMIQRTPQGKAIRDKLIALETNVSELSPELRLLINMEIKQRQQDRELADVRQQVDGIKELVALNPTAWREDCRRLLAKVAQARGGGGAYQDVNAEAFALVDERGGVSLTTRLTNKRQRMAAEGVCKSRRDKLTKVDVIAEDKKLIEIYIAVVKDMAVKYGVAGRE